MTKKTKIIFIIVFIIVGLIILGLYFLSKKPSTEEEGGVSVYEMFNPFGKNNPEGKDEPSVTNTPNEQGEEEKGIVNLSRFYQITDFAVSGATFIEDTRLIDIINKKEKEPKQIETVSQISSSTKEGRMEIQTILNEIIEPTPRLEVNGTFNESTIKAINAFQKLNGLKITGKIDAQTAPYFTKTIISTQTEEVSDDPYEEAPSVRYVERKNGHVYRTFLDTKEREKISNLTITTIYEAFFNNNANYVLNRYLSEDDIINSVIMKNGSSFKDFLPQNISDVAISGDKTKLFYLIKNSDSSTGLIRSFDNSKENIVFNSPFTEWLPQWTNNQNIYLTTKPYFGADGSIFLLNTTNKTTTKILGDIPGLTTLVNKNDSSILYSISTNKGPELNVFNIKKREFIDLKTYGLPEKCVWSNDLINVYCAVPNVITGNQYPNIWYQGLISFDDYFVKINTITGEKTTIINSINETPIDGINLFLNDKEDMLFFTNKKDYTLWSLEI